jgi:hypothetical protein
MAGGNRLGRTHRSVAPGNFTKPQSIAFRKEDLFWLNEHARVRGVSVSLIVNEGLNMYRDAFNAELEAVESDEAKAEAARRKAERAVLKIPGVKVEPVEM